MDSAKRKRLAAAGWRVGTAQEFLGLSPDEAAFVEVKLTLSARVRDERARLGLTQKALAKRLGSSQSRVAKLEAGDPTVSLDLLARALIALGTRPRQIARMVTSRKRGTSDSMAFLEKLTGSPLTLSKLLRSIREGESLTQAEFAETLGISKQHLSHIENDRKVVSPERAARWASILGYAESQFLRLALQDELRRAGLRYTVTVDAA